MGKTGTKSSQTISGAVRTLGDKKGVKEEGTQMAQSAECLLSNCEDLSLVCSAYIKNKKWLMCIHDSSTWGSRERRAPGAFWSARLAILCSIRDPVSKIKVRATEEDTHC